MAGKRTKRRYCRYWRQTILTICQRCLWICIFNISGSSSEYWIFYNSEDLNCLYSAGWKFPCFPFHSQLTHHVHHWQASEVQLRFNTTLPQWNCWKAPQKKRICKNSILIDQNWMRWIKFITHSLVCQNIFGFASIFHSSFISHALPL